MMRPSLNIEKITLYRNNLTVCEDATLTVHAGEITVLLGPNGAGKSTLLDGIAGVIPTHNGRVMLNGEEITKWTPFRRTNAGIGYVQQGRTVFKELTVRENLSLVDSSKNDVEEALELFPRLTEIRNTKAGFLSGGEQQMLVLARTIAMKPKFMLIDEPSYGLAPKVVTLIMRVLKQLSESGTGILLVEQYAKRALEISKNTYVIQKGKIKLSEASNLLLENPDSLKFTYF
ncbi:MAG TPA: ABC transporter ATP-binding protein [Microbacteriaceae bacterium]|nr:ABC transporter ATP-binding protein [Microbacteriaceae bacterium]